MSSPQTSQLLRSAPYFPVADVDRSASHYEGVFGFRREYVAGTPPQFAILSRYVLGFGQPLAAPGPRED